MKKIPWLSLTLLLAAYITFSWFLTHTFTQFLTFSTITYWAWGIVLGLTILQTLLLTTLFDPFKRVVSRWLRSDTGYFTLIIGISFGAVIAFIWYTVTGYFLVLIAAEILARLDLQNAKFSRLQALTILTVISMLGLAIGLLATLQLTPNVE
ncbi:MAG TPA: hypothetical protein V6C57_03010 [Coleofasciculaceae cyanobacterium]